MQNEIPLKIAVCDDEKEIRLRIKKNVELLFPDAWILLFENGTSLLEFREDIDILFLDIQMEGINGMEVAEKLRKNGSNAVIIFVTALEEYVFQAFDVGAFHYIVKPFEQGKFFEVLKNAVNTRQKIKTEELKEESAVTIKTGSITQKVYLNEIRYMEVFNRKITLHKQSGSLEFYGKLSKYEALLGEDFMRCHRSFLVNLRYVRKYDAGSIMLENGESILLSKQKYGDFVKKYMEYTERLMKKQNSRKE